MPAVLAGTAWPGPVRRSVAGAVAMLAALVVFSHGAVAQTPAADDAAGLGRPLKVLDPAYMDTTVKACTDFFGYANGRWLATDVIPAAYSSDGVGRDMTDRNELAVRSVLDDAMANRHSAAASSTDRKLGTYYATCMDSTRAESDGMKPLDPMLDTIAAIRTRGALVQTIAALHERGVRVVFAYGATSDFHDTFHYIAALQQSGLGMPDRNYYTDTGHVADSLRTAYVHHVARLLALSEPNRIVRSSGIADARAEDDAHGVMALETALAEAQLTRVAQREPRNIDHPMSFDSLRALVPNVDWRGYFQRSGLTHAPTRVNVNEPGYLERVNVLIDSVPLTDWRVYLRYHLLAQAAPWLSTPFVQEDFSYTSLFTGATALLPRWKRCLQSSDRQLGEALGQAYVEKTFSAAAKARARQIIDDVRAAFRERLLHLTWMSDTTRAYALDKLAKMGEKVGYPDKWRDYSRLVITDGPFVLNSQHASIFEWQRVANRPGMPVDMTEWGMSVPTVNAYNNPTKNEMVFPAGALEPQTFDPNADDGANYGSLAGSWAGHELTHGFDDEGRHFDAHGNLRDWWTPADSAAFTRQADLMVQQYDGYLQVDSVHVNGRLTLGENIADFGGVLTGFDALEAALARDGRPGLIDGLTPEQRYFVSFAQSWRDKDRPAALRARVTTDPHSPDRWRTNGPLSDDPEFAKTFGCKPGDPMVRPADEVPHIW
jgi:putative endopeptidase